MMFILGHIIGTYIGVIIGTILAVKDIKDPDLSVESAIKLADEIGRLENGK